MGLARPIRSVRKFYSPTISLYLLEKKVLIDTQGTLWEKTVSNLYMDKNISSRTPYLPCSVMGHIFPILSWNIMII